MHGWYSPEIVSFFRCVVLYFILTKHYFISLDFLSCEIGLLKKAKFLLKLNLVMESEGGVGVGGRNTQDSGVAVVVVVKKCLHTIFEHLQCCTSPPPIISVTLQDEKLILFPEFQQGQLLRSQSRDSLV